MEGITTKRFINLLGITEPFNTNCTTMIKGNEGMSEMDKMLFRIITLSTLENQYYDGKKFWFVKRYNDSMFLHYTIIQKVGSLTIKFQILQTLNDPRRYGYWNEFLAK